MSLYSSLTYQALSLDWVIYLSWCIWINAFSKISIRKTGNKLVLSKPGKSELKQFIYKNQKNSLRFLVFTLIYEHHNISNQSIVGKGITIPIQLTVKKIVVDCIVN